MSVFSPITPTPSDRTNVNNNTPVSFDAQGFQATPAAATIASAFVNRPVILTGLRVKIGTLPASGTTTVALFKNNVAVGSGSISFTSASTSSVAQIGVSVSCVADDLIEVRTTSAGTGAANIACRAIIVGDFSNG